MMFVCNFTQIDKTSRTKLVKFHISLTFIYRVLSMMLSYLLVPLTINYLNKEQYGIWITLLSIMSWITFFDIGLGHGLRNKLTEALALNDINRAITYVSTAFFTIFSIAMFMFLIFMLILPVVSWNKIFNTNSVSNIELMKVVFVVGVFSLINFILSLYNSIYYAFQQASISTLSSVLSNLFAVITIYILINTSYSSLFYLGLCYGLSTIFSNIILIKFFLKRHKELIPAKKYVDVSKIKEIASLGVKFFVIQIAVLIIFTTDNIIITQVLGPEHVTPYNVVFRLFSIIIMLHGIISTPLWSAYTDAYTKGDVKWIKNTLKKLNLLMIPIVITVIVLIIFAKDIIKIWIGSEIKIPHLLVIFMGIYSIVSVWNNIYAYFVNGIGRIQPQLYSSVIAGLINIPLSIYFSKYLQMGSSGVVLGTIVSLSLFAFIGPIQTYIFLKNYKWCINE